MTYVYKFKVKLYEFESKIWRDIEISSLSTVAKLAYATLSAFEAAGSHLFCVRHKGIKYEYKFDNFWDNVEATVDPRTVKLTKLKLAVGDKLTLEYDYGAGWIFDIKLVAITEMERGTGAHYPYITAGKGYGIIEDAFPGVLMEYIEQTDRTGELPIIYDPYNGEEIEWDYRNFDIELKNRLFKGKIDYIKENYEEE